MFPRFQQRCCTGFDTRKPTFLCVVGHKENGANQAANQPVVPFILSRWHQDKLRIILDTAWHSQDMPYATESMSFLTVFFFLSRKNGWPLLGSQKFKSEAFGWWTLEQHMELRTICAPKVSDVFHDVGRLMVPGPVLTKLAETVPFFGAETVSLVYKNLGFSNHHKPWFCHFVLEWWSIGW